MSIFASKMKLSVDQFPTAVSERKGTKSKLKTFRDGFKIIFFIAKVCHREYPYVIYIPLTILALVFSTFNIFLIYMEFLEKGLVLKVPTLIMNATIFLSGLFFMAVGIILNSIDNLRYEQRHIAYLLNLPKD